MGRGTKSTTLADLLPRAARALRQPLRRSATRTATQWVNRSFDEVCETVRALSLGLIDLGVAKGDKVSILANTRPEWTYFDFAALSAGAIVVPIYQTNSPEECQYVLENSDAKVVIVEDDEQLEKIRAVRDQLPKLEHVVRMTGTSEDAISLEDLAARGAGRDAAEWEARWRLGDPGRHLHLHLHLGHDRPAEGLRHQPRQLPRDARHGQRDQRHRGRRRHLPLPAPRPLLRPADPARQLRPRRDARLLGARPAEDPAQPGRTETDLLPVGAADLREDLHRRDQRHGKRGRPQKGDLRLVDRGRQEDARRPNARARKPGFLLRKQYEFADKQVLSKIRGLFGGKLRLAVSGAAPINPEILRFFDAAGVLVLEGWGMTETSTAATISTADDFKFGTIGKPFPGCEVKIADDGEILVKGPNVFQGYYKNEEATRETIVDGWLHTGDIGEIDADGFIKITGRKKDIIITAGGKNITPANLENEIKQHPLVSQCVVVGDRRPYLVALVTLDPEEAVAYAKEHGLPEDPAQLAANPDDPQGRSRPTSTRSTRNSPGSSRSRRSRSSPTTSPRKPAS